MNKETARQILRSGGSIICIGQIEPELKRSLDRAVRKGTLIKYRGFWNTESPLFGVGSLKTIYRAP